VSASTSSRGRSLADLRRRGKERIPKENKGMGQQPELKFCELLKRSREETISGLRTRRGKGQCPPGTMGGEKTATEKKSYGGK